MRNKPKRSGKVADAVEAPGISMFHFYFGGNEYSVKLRIVPGSLPFIIFRNDLDRSGLNYRKYHKMIDGQGDGYQKNGEMRNFCRSSYFLKTVSFQK